MATINKYTGRQKKKNLTYHPLAWRFIYPQHWNEKLICSNNVTDILKRYPATGSTRITLNGESYLDEVEINKPDIVPEPNFLTVVDDHIQTEIDRQDCEAPDKITVRFEIYKEVFQWLIEAYSSYKTILADLKREYESVINKYKNQVSHLRSLKEIMWTLERDADQRIIICNKNDNIEIERLKQENATILDQINQLKRKVDYSKEEIQQIKHAIDEEEKMFTVERDYRGNSVKSALTLRSQLHELSSIQLGSNVISENNDRLMEEIKKLKDSHSRMVREIIEIDVNFVETRMEHEFNEITMFADKFALESVEMEYSWLHLQDDINYKTKMIRRLVKKTQFYKNSLTDHQKSFAKPHISKILEMFIWVERMSVRFKERKERKSKRTNADQTEQNMSHITNINILKNLFTRKTEPISNPILLRGLLELVLGMRAGSIHTDFSILKDTLNFE